MNSSEIYRYRQSRGLCVKCGEELPAQHKHKMCDACCMITRIKQRGRYQNWSDDQKAHHKQYNKEWREAHPDRVAIYKKRQTEYNRRYKEKYL